jgi:predicted DNA-binding transcriptional regulator AlpA
MDESLWTVKDVSAFLGVPVATIYQWRVRGEGPPAVKLGRHLRYVPSSVAAWVAAQAEAA